MAVPKRKMSRANTRTRRSAWKADLTELNTIKDPTLLSVSPCSIVSLCGTNSSLTRTRFSGSSSVS